MINTGFVSIIEILDINRKMFKDVMLMDTLFYLRAVFKDIYFLTF